VRLDLATDEALSMPVCGYQDNTCSELSFRHPFSRAGRPLPRQRWP